MKLTQLHSANANAYRSASIQAPAIVVFDEFVDADKPGVHTHGEQVEMELKRRQPGLQVSRVEVALERSTEAIEAGEPGSLDSYLKDHFVSRVETAGEAWQELVQGARGRALVHQSQGASESRAVAPLWRQARHDVPFRNALETQLGLAQSQEPEMSSSTRKTLLAALVSRSGELHRRDPEIQEAIQDLRSWQGQAAAESHLHVISAGNEGSLARQLKELGIPLPSQFFRNELASPASIIVGAADDGSIEPASGQPAGVARIANPFAGAHLAADGVDRPMAAEGEEWLATGSSYATPQVSSLSVDILRQQPLLGRDGLLTILLDHATPLPGQERFVGGGVVSYPLDR